MNSPHVLIIEDEHRIRDIMMYALGKREYHVTPCETAEEGLDALKKDSYDLILLNLNLPGMSGEDFLKKIRNSGDYTPVIIVTASVGREEGLASFGDYGVVDFVEKPFKSTDMVQRIEEAMKTAENLKVIHEANIKIGEFIKKQDAGQ